MPGKNLNTHASNIKIHAQKILKCDWSRSKLLRRKRSNDLCFFGKFCLVLTSLAHEAQKLSPSLIPGNHRLTTLAIKHPENPK